MKRKCLAIGIILLFVVTAITPSTAQKIEKQSLPTSRGNWLYVGGSGPGNYTKIQDAIDNASNGDTVFVFAGLYMENVYVNKSVTLLGENRDTTIIDANGKGCPVDLEANNVIVNGFTLQNSGNVLYNDAGVHFKNWGDVPDSNSNRIIGNKMINNYDGIFGIYSENNYISDNVIINNRHCGIFFLAGCTSSIIKNNTIMRNDYGVAIQDTLYVQVIENNIENNNEIGVLLVAGGSSNDVKFNNIANNSNGIVLSGGPYGTGSNNIFSNTIAYNDEYGLILEDAYWNKIHKNNLIENTVHAIFSYELGVKIMGFFFGRFLQLNKFYRNYWDDHLDSQAYIIKGELWWEWLNIYPNPPVFRNITWYNFD